MGSHFFVILTELKATEESQNTRCFALYENSPVGRASVPAN
jgi:hypothetical protein